MQYSFCPKCGSRLNLRFIEGTQRLVCSGCAFIFYQHSKLCVAVLVVDRERLLLAQRAVEPFKDYWDIPGGFLEAGEAPEAGAIREIAEETGLRIQPTLLLGLFMDTYGPGGDPVLNICYEARVLAGQLRARDDVKRLQWFDLDGLPDEIAFDWSTAALRLLQNKLLDNTGGKFGCR